MARTRRTTSRPFKGTGHDHGRCVAAALERAAEVCAAKGARLTVLRRRVLELVWARHRPIGAYDILAALGRRRGSVAPPTVYRALEFLKAHGLIHRIESLNAFVGCERPGQPHCGQFLICRACGRAAELADGRIDAALRRSLAEAGFALERPTIEAVGLCPDCRPAGEAGNA
jgi:Fur family zinc uptake transcriptional regulator